MDRLLGGLVGGVTFGTLLLVMTGIGVFLAPAGPIATSNRIELFIRISVVIYAASLIGGLLVALVSPIARFWYGAMIAGFVGLVPYAVSLAHLLNPDSPYATSSGLLFAGILGPLAGFIIWVLEMRNTP